MQAVILAAGRGSRLGERGEQTPKCLLQLDERRIIEHQLETLAEAGVAPVAMIVGYCADEIREIVGIRAEYIHNPRWGSTNSLYSFWLSKKWVKGPVIILNSDTVIHPDILNRLMSVEGDAVAYDSCSGNAPEHMKVNVVGRELKDMSKDLPVEKSHGENVGILKFSSESAQRLFQIAGGLLQEGHEKSWLGSAVRELIKERSVRAIDIAGLPWGEIDSCYDLDFVRKAVLPRIKTPVSPFMVIKRVVRNLVVPVLSVLILILGYHSYMGEARENWENSPIVGAESVLIESNKSEQRWWMLSGKLSPWAKVYGPDTIVVDSRALFDSDSKRKEANYVLEVSLDGKRVDWLMNTSKRSSRWHHNGDGLGQREWARIELPEGEHTLGIRLVASDTKRSLIRVRRSSMDDD